MTYLHTAIGSSYHKPNLDHASNDYSCWYDAYFKGYRQPNYPVPAIPLEVKYDYVGCVNIDDVTDPKDPIIVWVYDSWGFLTLQNI